MVTYLHMMSLFTGAIVTVQKSTGTNHAGSSLRLCRPTEWRRSHRTGPGGLMQLYVVDDNISAKTGAGTLIVIPALNEERSIGRVIAELRRSCPQADLLVVDDGSTDQTASVAAQAGAPTLILPFNIGVGGAMRAGYRYALRHGYDSVVQVDADGQHDTSYIGALLLGLRDCDLVIGARFAGEGEYCARGPRRWAMRLLAVTLSALAGRRLTDVTSGFRAA